MNGTRGPYHDPYANLAAAIIASGKRCHDKKFLESDWCDTLKRMCALDDEMYGGRVLLTTRGGYNLESN